MFHLEYEKVAVENFDDLPKKKKKKICEEDWSLKNLVYNFSISDMTPSRQEQLRRYKNNT